MSATILNPPPCSGVTGNTDVSYRVTGGDTGDTRAVSPPVTHVCIPSNLMRVSPTGPQVTVCNNLILSLTV